MDEKRAITAIRDIEQESFIAATLSRLGWQLLYRATSPLGLQAELQKNPDASLFLSDDFLPSENISFPTIFLLRGRSHARGTAGEFDPRNLFELEELIRSGAGRKSRESSPIAPTQSKVLALLSAEGKIGVTTLAINVAERAASAGLNVLLVDGDQSQHAIAAHFEVHNIRREPRVISPLLSLFEVSERSQLEKVSRTASEFDLIVIDLGRVGNILPNGLRIDDQIFEWVNHSHGRVVLSSGDQENSIKRSLITLNNLRKLASDMDIEIAISLNEPTSRRNRSLLSSKLSAQSLTPVHLFSCDTKAVHSFEQAHTTLIQVAPRSALTREIAQYVEEHLLKVSSK